MGALRTRTPDAPRARTIAEALYADLGRVEWIPSDDADVFRLTFRSDRKPRILKVGRPGNRAVWREVGAFPVMRRLGVLEVLEFEYTTEDLPPLGTDFHVTCELVDPKQASRAMANAWIYDRERALDLAHWLGACTRRVESLDWREVPRATSPERAVEIGRDWLLPQYRELLARSDCPSWARAFIDRLIGERSRAEGFDAFGGWAGEMLQADSERFVLIDWPGLGAAPRGSLAAVALEVLQRFRAWDPGPLVERFLAGWTPGGLDEGRREDLRRGWVHGILWWPGLHLHLAGEPEIDLSGVYAAAWLALENDEPASWLSRDASAAPP